MRSQKQKPVVLDHVQVVNLRALIQNCQNMVQNVCDGHTDHSQELDRIVEILEETKLPKELEPL